MHLPQCLQICLPMTLPSWSSHLISHRNPPQQFMSAQMSLFSKKSIKRPIFHSIHWACRVQYLSQALCYALEIWQWSLLSRSLVSKEIKYFGPLCFLNAFREQGVCLVSNLESATQLLLLCASCHFSPPSSVTVCHTFNCWSPPGTIGSQLLRTDHYYPSSHQR